MGEVWAWRKRRLIRRLKAHFDDPIRWPGQKDVCRFGSGTPEDYVVHVGDHTQRTCLLHLPVELRMAHQRNPDAEIWVTRDG